MARSKTSRFYYWPQSELGQFAMFLLVAGAAGVTCYREANSRGGSDESGVVAGLVSAVLWCAIVITIRYIIYRVTRSSSYQEKTELKSLRRKLEIQKLKDELGTAEKDSKDDGDAG